MSCIYKRPYIYADCCPNYTTQTPYAPPQCSSPPIFNKPPQCINPQPSPCMHKGNQICIKIEGIIRLI